MLFCSFSIEPKKHRFALKKSLTLSIYAEAENKHSCERVSWEAMWVNCGASLQEAPEGTRMWTRSKTFINIMRRLGLALYATGRSG